MVKNSMNSMKEIRAGINVQKKKQIDNSQAYLTQIELVHTNPTQEECE